MRTIVIDNVEPAQEPTKEEIEKLQKAFESMKNAAILAGKACGRIEEIYKLR